MTLFDKIREAIFPAKPPTEVIGGVEVFKLGEREEGADGQVAGVVETSEVGKAGVLETPAPSGQEAIGSRDALNPAPVGVGAVQLSTPVQPHSAYGQSRRRPGR